MTDASRFFLVAVTAISLATGCHSSHNAEENASSHALRERLGPHARIEIDHVGDVVGIAWNAGDVSATDLQLCATLVRLRRLEWNEDTNLENDAWAELSGISSLRTLHLVRIPLNAAAMAEIAKCRGLRRLVIDDCPGVTEETLAPLSHLVELRSLWVSGSKVTSASLWHLRNLTSLRQLKLAESAITNSGLSHLKALSQLQLIDLSGSKITDEGISTLGELESLESLGLCGTQVTSRGVEQLVKLKRLRVLVLDATRVDDNALKSIAKMRCLQHLKLSGTRVTDVGVSQLAELPHLETLDASSTAIRGKCFRKPLRWPALRSLVVHSGCLAEPILRDRRGGGLLEVRTVPSVLPRRQDVQRLADAPRANSRAH